ncbi:M3 family oligoendopeptidase [Oceanirhabdus sp. W0125-5]|uniref:M3 family oligoendopeptidase n=1 Tax=Oceanirhabdus sp. W0125-5 TaxID=2999116 RepID=UPI0022F309C3|nr:M3 family oligoendopeptidase [Oceanirhabdus sp. W0125-5]WBW98406.1 M3 family oligoendopeptidase [Oceanirhabdus sp. W0125-5]
MDMRWSLNEIYPSFESDAFKNDLNLLNEQIKENISWVETNCKNYDNTKEKLEDYLKSANEFEHLVHRLYSFASLNASVDVKNVTANKTMEQLSNKLAELAKTEALFEKWVGGIADLDTLIEKSDVLKVHSFYLNEIKRNASYLLDDTQEEVLAKIKTTGSTAWSKLQGNLTSNLLVDIEVDGEMKQLPLSVVRNMAYDKDSEKRKAAYEAELESYTKIDESVAASLNGIKGEVITESKLRGYSSPLAVTLQKSRMNEATLNAMMEAMKESLPAFRKYFKKKAELLGYKNGLPFYELFAPMGEVNMTYTYEEARDFIVKNFSTFSRALGDYAAHAFDNNWIDAEPRKGKRGGAFCSNLHYLKQSRILSNFNGSFSNVTTLAHELGHGYHGKCLVDEISLNSHYPMPIAETASIFCETIVTNAALKTASKEESFAILESDIQGNAQVIVDIMSRFLFESKVFDERKDGSVSVERLKEIMIEAQKETYGDGLDPEYLHPYMWVCKPHYYSAGNNFYNFPYAFGLLFSKGLYAEYLKRGDEFVREYDTLLAATGKNNLIDVAKMMNIDITSKDFWKNSLDLIAEDIEKFVNL